MIYRSKRTGRLIKLLGLKEEKQPDQTIYYYKTFIWLDHPNTIAYWNDTVCEAKGYETFNDYFEAII